jgi:hypothetical protein
MALPDDPLWDRVREELGYRRQYGQPCNRIYLGEDAFVEAMSLYHVNLWTEHSGTYNGIPFAFDALMPSTCFRIE